MIDVIRPDPQEQMIEIPITVYRNLVERSVRVEILMELFERNQFVSDMDTMTILGFPADLIGAIGRNNARLLKEAKEHLAEEVEEDIPYGNED